MQRVVISVCFATAALDQASKHLAQRLLISGRPHAVIDGLLYLTYVRNPGIAFGLIPNRPLLITGVGILGLFLLLSGSSRLLRGDSPALIGAGLAAGGALGNIADRLRFGEVIDFIDFRVWPVFNLADVAIVCGAALIGLRILRASKENE